MRFDRCSIRTSERLSDADIDRVCIVAVATIERKRRVDTNRSDRGVITQSDTGGDAQRLAKVRIARQKRTADIHERDDPDRVGDLYTRLKRGLDKAAAADDFAGWAEWLRLR